MISQQALIEKWIKHIQRFLGRVARQWKLALLAMVLLLNLTGEGPAPSSLDTQINRMLAGMRFNFANWETETLLSKLAHSLVQPQRYMRESTRHDFFLAYLDLVAQTQQLNAEIQRTYADSEVGNPEAATSHLRAKLAERRAAEDARQLLAEAILEEQTACVLADEGFGLLGWIFPPPSVHFTPLPLLLVVSPREHIKREFSLGLRHGLGIAQREAIEEQVDTSFDVSSLVTGIGGLAAYPAMLLENSSLNWVTEVTAHEWTHHYLSPHPLGRNYDGNPETRTINETVASIAGQEIGRQVIAQYYPELLPPEPEPVAPAPEKPPTPPEPPAFDFRAEMRETRVRVDALLAEGRIDEAEAYMEERRQTFVANGYYIRKLNQAYFAFHGAYADQPGAAGADPIGPAVRELRASSADLHTFVTQIAPVTTLAELEAVLEATKTHELSYRSPGQRRQDGSSNPYPGRALR